MVDQNITTFFNKVYDETYKKVFGYVIAKCGDTNDIADILQETYTEVYSVMIKKGENYVNNYEAFILRVAKTKIFRHYSLKEKMKCLIPFFTDSTEKEINPIDFEFKDSISLEEQVFNNIHLEEIANYISKKPEVTKKVFYLFYYCEYTIPQISKELNISESNVKNKLYRTVKEVRQIYGKDGAHYE